MMYVHALPSPQKTTKRLVFLHGWGVSSDTLLPLASLFQDEAEVLLLDLPGFGKTPAPLKVYGTEDYAKEVADFIKTLPPKDTFVLGHSFGGRVCIQLGALFPDLIKGLVLIAGAGLPYDYTIGFRIKAFLIKTLSKIYKKIPFLPPLHLGSADYQAAKGIMRSIFVKTIKEDLSSKAKQVTLNTLLIYGKEDTATPASFGQRYHHLIPSSKLCLLDYQNHYTLLFEGKQQTAFFIRSFLNSL
ncbi:MAG: alpha/beta hydrolase [Alphaproteobacteria bacterium]|nr:alpha/beta hydrolase [Alphaproteobacteria bacterium]